MIVQAADDPSLQWVEACEFINSLIDYCIFIYFISALSN